MDQWLASSFVQVAPGEIKGKLAKAILEFVQRWGDAYAVRLAYAKRSDTKPYEVIFLNVDVDLPQRKAFEIQSIEPICIACKDDDSTLSVFAVREGFPKTPHQNSVPVGMPKSLCVDDRPWAEARLTWTAEDYLLRVREWFNKAARGELHDLASPLEPLFYASHQQIILQVSTLKAMAADETVRLMGYIRGDGDDNVILTAIVSGKFSGKDNRGNVATIFVELPDQYMQGINALPGTLSELIQMVNEFGLDLAPILRKKLLDWAAWEAGNVDMLSAQLVLILASKISDTTTSRTATHMRAFASGSHTAGDVGIALGCLAPGMKNDNQGRVTYVRTIGDQADGNGTGISIHPINVLIDFDRELALEISGQPSARGEMPVVMVGAGAIGSQIANVLSREGLFKWTIIDDDTLLPHNLSRHALTRGHVAVQKAKALAEHVADIFVEAGSPKHFVADCLTPPVAIQDSLNKAYGDASLILDTSASVAVSRFLSDLAVQARRISAFFNPTGTSAVLLVEDRVRLLTLRDLEAQYYRSVISIPELEDHLQPGPDGLRYTGSCRELTARIPASRAQLLSALTAGGISEAIGQEDAQIRIWKLEADGGVQSFRPSLGAAIEVGIADWQITLDSKLVELLRTTRASQLPKETGGVLLGVVDYERQRIHVAHCIDGPSDSVSSSSEFERGIRKLPKIIEAACGRVMHQVRYIGEWHSHPSGASARPSETDIGQINWLAKRLEPASQPGVMLIVAEDEMTIAIGDIATGIKAQIIPY